MPAPKARAPKCKPKPKPASEPLADVDMSAVAAVERDLARMPADVAQSTEAATALAMALRLDEGGGSPSECAKALLDARARLREMAPAKRERTRLDDLSDRRAKKLKLAVAGGADS